jgi:hypothetical protein
MVASNGGIVTVPPYVYSKRDQNLPSWYHEDFNIQKAMRDALIIVAWDGIATHGTTSTKVDLATQLFESAFGPDPVEEQQSSSTVEAATLDDKLSAALKGRQHFSNLMELAEVDDARYDSVEPNSNDKGWYLKAPVVRFNPRRFHVQNDFNRESVLAVNKQCKTFIDATTILSKKTKILGEVKKMDAMVRMPVHTCACSKRHVFLGVAHC